MPSGRRCWKVEVRALVAALLAVCALAGWWWLRQPRTPAELYAVRCAACHELPDVCAYRADERPAIVDMMLAQHGADEVIDAREAPLIAEFLAKELMCP